MSMLEKMLGDSWTSETAKAWTELWDSSATAMMKADPGPLRSMRACCQHTFPIGHKSDVPILSVVNVSGLGISVVGIPVVCVLTYTGSICVGYVLTGI
jgi:hypothetical protein